MTGKSSKSTRTVGSSSKSNAPDEPGHGEAELDPRERSAEAAVEAEAEGFARGEPVVVVFGGTLARGQPAFRGETVGVGEVLGRAVDGEGADADFGLEGC